ncbi:hypothetical protein BC828DRAFT_390992 [Blastocladiella britannica]|nr:hypothetical protein BC828DRAFT_390992 [Blastocladiella britannica]
MPRNTRSPPLPHSAAELTTTAWSRPEPCAGAIPTPNGVQSRNLPPKRTRTWFVLTVKSSRRTWALSATTRTPFWMMTTKRSSTSRRPRKTKSMRLPRRRCRPLPAICTRMSVFLNFLLGIPYLVALAELQITQLSTNSTIATTMLTDEDEDEEELESALMYDPTSLSTADQFMAAMTTSTTPPRVMLVMHAGFAMLLAVLLALGIYTFGDTGNVYVWALLVINSALWFAVTSLAMSIGDGATTTGDGDDQEDEEPMTMSDEGQSLLDMGF